MRAVPIVLVLAVATSARGTAAADSLYDRLLDPEGPVPGLAGFSVKRKPDATFCGGVAVITTRAKKVAPDDAPLASVYALAFPTGLDFEKAKDSSQKQLETWIASLQKVGTDAGAHYRDQLANGKDTNAKLAAVARIVQIEARLASVLARAAIPKDVRTGDLAKDKTDAYCSALAEAAAPLQKAAEDARARCATKLDGMPAGWWNAVCGAKR